MRQFRILASRYVPVLVHWTDLTAFCGMVAFAGGIWFVSNLPEQSIIAQPLLYPVYLISATVCLATGILGGTKTVRGAAFFVAGALMYQLQTAHHQKIEACIADLPSVPLRIMGDVIAPPAPYRDKFKFLLKLRESGGNCCNDLSGKIFVCTSELQPPSSGLISFDGHISFPGHRRNRYDFDEAAFFRANGYAGKIVVEKTVSIAPPEDFTGRLSTRFRQWLPVVFKRYENTDHRALIRASFTGEKAYIAPEIDAVFQRSGLYHLLALSGFNAAILLAAVYVLLAPFPLGITAKHLIAIAVLWVYNGFVGPIPSLMRAVIMATAVIGALMFQRKNYPLQTFGLAGIIWLLLSPSSLFQPGFQLSYGATFGILTLHPLFTKLYRGAAQPLLDYLLRPLIGSLSVSIAAFLTTLPILLYHFGTVSLFGIIANIAAIPLMSASMWAFFCAMLAAPFAGWISDAGVAVSGWLLDAVLMIAGFSGKVPFSLITTYAPYPELTAAFYLLLVAVLVVERSNVGKILAWGVPLLLCIVAADHLVRRAATFPTVVRFATGAGAAATVVRWPQGYAWLFCSGKESALRYIVQRDVAAWVRHVPGTTISRQFTADERTGRIVMSAEGGKREESAEGRMLFLKIIHTAEACTCTFDASTRRSGLTFACGGAELISDHTRPFVYLRGGGSVASDTFAAPFEASMRRGRFSVHPW